MTKIFKHYNPHLLNFPLKLILKKDEFNSKQDFISLNCCAIEYITINDLVYIEYVPTQFEHLLNKIPKSNWEILLFKDKNNENNRE